MSNQASHTSPTAGGGYQVPAGYTEQSGDIVGFWTGEGAVHFIPRFVRIFDSNIDEKKPSTLLVGELVDPCELFKPSDTDEKEVVLGGKGQKIGIWTKPGMSALKALGGIPVYMYEDGEKNTGKPNPMKLFKVMSKGQGQKLPIEKDMRKFSKPAPRQATAITDDDLPF